MTKKEFATLAMGLKTYYPREQLLPNEQAMELWYRELQDIPYEVAQAALRKWVSTQKWSPTIAEIRELSAEIAGGDVPDWGSGWQQVSDAMRKYGREYPQSAYRSMHPLVAEAAQQMGAWWDVCTSTNLDTDRANFRMIYEALVRRRKTDQQLALPLRESISRLQSEGALRLEGGFGNEDGNG